MREAKVLNKYNLTLKTAGCEANDFNGWQCDWWGHF